MAETAEIASAKMAEAMAILNYAKMAELKKAEITEAQKIWKSGVGQNVQYQS